MRTLIILSVVLFELVLSVPVFASEPKPLQEVAAQIQTERDQLKTAHLTRIIEEFDNRKSAAAEANKSALCRRNCIYRAENWIDETRQIARTEERSLDGSDSNYIGIAKDGFELSQVVTTSQYYLEPLARRYQLFDPLYLGFVEIKGGLVTKDESSGGLRIVTTTILLAEHADINRVIITTLDPSVGYRCRKMQMFQKGRLLQEATFDDYKTISGIPYPHRYSSQSYDANGIVVRGENIHTESAEFNIELKDIDLIPPAPTEMTVTDTRADKGAKYPYRSGTVLKIQKGQPMWPKN